MKAAAVTEDIPPVRPANPIDAIPDSTRVGALVVIFAIVIVFWMVFHQNHTTILYWAIDNTDWQSWGLNFTGIIQAAAQKIGVKVSPYFYGQQPDWTSLAATILSSKPDAVSLFATDADCLAAVPAIRSSGRSPRRNTSQAPAQRMARSAAVADTSMSTRRCSELVSSALGTATTVT